MTPPSAQPLYLEARAEPVFALLHSPEEGTGTGVGVLLCPPFGWEEVCSYRSRRAWARALAHDGHSAMRLDLPGTGDSGGSPRAPARLDAWTAAVGEGVRALREQAGCRRVAAIGLSLGGLLVMRALAEGARIDDVVLWSVPGRGKRLIRELRAFSRLRPAVRDESVDPGISESGGASVEAGGFVLAPETAKELSALDVTALALPPDAPGRALLLDRDGIEVDHGLLACLESAGAAVTTAPGPGYSTMVDHPQSAVPPRQVFETVGAWLRPGGGAGQVPTAPPTPAVTAKLHAEDGSSARESPLSVRVAGSLLFGVLTEPSEGPRRDLCAVIPGAGGLRRIGPGRMWVELARRWAARGISTLRIDLEGIGDADGPDEGIETPTLYRDELVEQTLAVLDALDERGLPRRFVLLGLCSGAFWAFQAALRDERVVAAFALNPGALFWDDLLLDRREARLAREGLHASSWRKLARGDVSPGRVLEIGRSALTAPFHARAQAEAEAAGERKVEEALDQLRDAGKDIVFTFGEREAVHAELDRAGVLRRLGRWPNVAVERIPLQDHSFEAIRAQTFAHEILDRALGRLLTGVGAGAGPGCDDAASSSNPTGANGSTAAHGPGTARPATT